jgi:hypothetical protein
MIEHHDGTMSQDSPRARRWQRNHGRPVPDLRRTPSYRQGLPPSAHLAEALTARELLERRRALGQAVDAKTP